MECKVHFFLLPEQLWHQMNMNCCGKFDNLTVTFCFQSDGCLYVCEFLKKPLSFVRSAGEYPVMIRCLFSFNSRCEACVPSYTIDLFGITFFACLFFSWICVFWLLAGICLGAVPSALGLANKKLILQRFNLRCSTNNKLTVHKAQNSGWFPASVRIGSPQSLTNRQTIGWEAHSSQQGGGFPPRVCWAGAVNKWRWEWCWKAKHSTDTETGTNAAAGELLPCSRTRTSSRRTRSCHLPSASSAAPSVSQTPPRASANPEWKSVGRPASRTDLPRCLIHCWQGRTRTQVISGIRLFATWCGDHSCNKCGADSSFIHRTTLAISTIRILSFTIQLPNLPCCHNPRNSPDQMSKTTLWVTHINRKNVCMVKISLS